MPWTNSELADRIDGIAGVLLAWSLREAPHLRRLAVLLPFVLLLTNSGCCAIRAARIEPVRDRFEVFAMVGIGTPPKCCVMPPDQTLVYPLRVGERARIWVRTVYFDNIRKAAKNVDMALDSVDLFGDTVDSASIEPSIAVSNADGFSPKALMFQARKIGTYRIRVLHTDKHNKSVSYSPTIVVTE